jgi:2-octaprenyl-6-methoxyphenol hydroxylase
MRQSYDVLVSGAGPVGMAAALLAARAGYRVALADARADGAWQGDPRALALSEGSRHLLQRLDAWPAGSPGGRPAATPITEVHVSQRGAFGRSLLTAREQGLPALGYVVPYAEVCRALRTALDRSPVTLLWSSPVGTARDGSEILQVAVGDARLASRLLVHAEGAGDDGAALRVVDYRQDALLCEATPAVPHGGRAWERFTAAGPVALLPCGPGYAVVLVAEREAAAALAAADDATFRAELEQRFGQHLRFTALGPRSRVPLALRVRPRLTAPRRVWIGNAAQALHPISGQGLNLGLRDAASLGEALARHAGGDPGAIASAPAWRRQFDRAGAIAFTDGLVRLFGLDLPPLAAARGLGLAALDLFPPLRRQLATRMIFGWRG